MRGSSLGVVLALAMLSSVAVGGKAPSATQVPKPFPEAGARQTTAPDPTGMPVYPAAQFLETFDAGKGQQFHLYGTDVAYAEIVAYYKNTLKNNGRVLFQGPLMHQFDLGRFDDNTMAYPPSVVVKDYSWDGSEGYLHVSGTTSTRYKTIIQIVLPKDR